MNEKPDMFNPYILLESFCGTGIVHIIGGHCSNTKVTVNSGSPYQAAYNEAFEIAVALRVPLWIGNQFESKIAYNPNVERKATRTEEKL